MDCALDSELTNTNLGLVNNQGTDWWKSCPTYTSLDKVDWPLTGHRPVSSQNQSTVLKVHVLLLVQDLKFKYNINSNTVIEIIPTCQQRPPWNHCSSYFVVEVDRGGTGEEVKGVLTCKWCFFLSTCIPCIWWKWFQGVHSLIANSSASVISLSFAHLFFLFFLNTWKVSDFTHHCNYMRICFAEGWTAIFWFHKYFRLWHFLLCSWDIHHLSCFGRPWNIYET